MSHQHVVGVEISCDDASVGLVAVFCFDLEIFFLAGFRAVAAGIGISNHFDEALFVFYRSRLSLVCDVETVDGGASLIAFRAFLQAQTVKAFAELLCQYDADRLLRVDLYLFCKLVIDEDIEIVVLRVRDFHGYTASRKVCLQVGAAPVKGYAPVVAGAYTSCIGYA